MCACVRRCSFKNGAITTIDVKKRFLTFFLFVINRVFNGFLFLQRFFVNKNVEFTLLGSEIIPTLERGYG